MLLASITSTGEGGRQDCFLQGRLSWEKKTILWVSSRKHVVGSGGSQRAVSDSRDEYVPSLYAVDEGRRARGWPPWCTADRMLTGEEHEDFEVAAQIKVAALHRPGAIRLRQPGRLVRSRRIKVGGSLDQDRSAATAICLCSTFISGHHRRRGRHHVHHRQRLDASVPPSPA